MYDLFKVYTNESGTEHYIKFPNEIIVGSGDTYKESVVDIINCFASCRNGEMEYSSFEGDELSVELDFVINLKSDDMSNAIVIGEFRESDRLKGVGTTECEALFDLASEVEDEFDVTQS